MNMSKYAYMLRVFVIVAICCSLHGCGAPNEVKSLAIERVKSSFNSEFEAKDFKIKKEDKESISSADRANGITDRWIFYVTFIFRTKPGIKIYNLSDRIDWTNGGKEIELIKKNGQLEIVRVRDY